MEAGREWDVTGRAEMGQETDSAWAELDAQLRARSVVRIDIIPGGGWVIHDARGRQGAGETVRASLDDLIARTRES